MRNKVCSCRWGSIPAHKSQSCRAANLFLRLYIHGSGRICSIRLYKSWNAKCICLKSFSPSLYSRGRIYSIRLYKSSAPSSCSKLASCHQTRALTTKTVASKHFKSNKPRRCQSKIGGFYVRLSNTSWPLSKKHIAEWTVVRYPGW